MSSKNRYKRILGELFLSKYREGAQRLEFVREEIFDAARKLDLPLPKNVGDVLYSFRYRSSIPEVIAQHTPEGHEWIIRPKGIAKYAFVLVSELRLEPNTQLVTVKVPDSTPGIVARYSLTDEQALLAKVRYNRLLDIFTGVTCYSLQNHLRTSVADMGQVETDELYIGVDKRGIQYVFPVQAKGGSDRQSVVQIEQDVAVCREKFPQLICRPIAAQFMAGGTIALLELEVGENTAIAAERHYRLVAPSEISEEDLKSYQSRLYQD